MKTAIDKNESEFNRLKRESLVWLEKRGKTAPPFISMAVNVFISSDHITDEEIKQIAFEDTPDSPQSDLVIHYKISGMKLLRDRTTREIPIITFEELIKILEDDFEWSNLKNLSSMVKGLLIDTINAIKSRTSSSEEEK